MLMQNLKESKTVLWQMGIFFASWCLKFWIKNYIYHQTYTFTIDRNGEYMSFLYSRNYTYLKKTPHYFLWLFLQIKLVISSFYRVTVWLITQTVFFILYCPIFSENTFSLNLKLEFFNEKSLLILEFYQKSILDFDATIL